jgi:positive phototaxis protein PixI
MTTNTTLARLQELLPQLFQPVQVTGDPYLRFQLTAEIPALISMNRVQEAVLVPASFISPLPNMPAFSIGMMNSRDRVFCVVDLGQLLGLPAMSINPRNYQVVVMNLSGQTPIDQSSPVAEKWLGLAVQQVQGVNRFERQDLQSIVGALPACLQPYLQGCFLEKDQEIVVLNSESIANSPSFLENP